MPDQQKKSSPILVAAAWIVVIVPAGWGLTYTVQNALKLFGHNPPPATAPASPTPAPAAH